MMDDESKGGKEDKAENYIWIWILHLASLVKNVLANENFNQIIVLYLGFTVSRFNSGISWVRPSLAGSAYS